MKTALTLICLPLTLALGAQTLPDSTLREISFDQKLGEKISLDLPFRDETGRAVELKDYFGKKPVILVLGYYGCPMLCTLVLNGMISGLQDVPLQMGRDYEVVNVSIDPREKPGLAAAKKHSYVSRFGQPKAAEGWHFLTGQDDDISQLAREVGFRYVFDPASRQYAHPSGLIVLTDDGQISRYLFGVTFSAGDLAAALAGAAKEKVASPSPQWFLLCFHYSPLTGKYSKVILTVVRAISIAVLLLLGGLVLTAWRRAKNTGGG